MIAIPWNLPIRCFPWISTNSALCRILSSQLNRHHIRPSTSSVEVKVDIPRANIRVLRKVNQNVRPLKRSRRPNNLRYVQLRPVNADLCSRRGCTQCKTKFNLQVCRRWPTLIDLTPG
ncbi:hypothetical protein AB6A40_009542 [Gnathostoma spinigerum]|uniref:Uncharacterized protein n=1 Tax=Gnathostoma spinigerum TaxID=75299 RepID=A0ABD6ESN6_9BILA